MDQGQLRWADGAALTLALSPRVLRTAAGGAAHGHWGRRKARNDEERTKPAQVNQTKSNQIKPNPTKSDQIRPNPTKSNQIKPDQDGSRAILDPGAGRWIKIMTRMSADRELGKNLRLYSGMFAYVRLCSLNSGKIVATSWESRANRLG